jgi:hypothetical protein
MTAAEDLHRRRETETALSRLYDGRSYTRKGLFSRVERWQDGLLRRLERSGAVEVEKRGRGKASLYRMKDDLEIEAMLNDEELLLQMVFPSYKPPDKDCGQVPMFPEANNADVIDELPRKYAQDEPVSLQHALESSDVMSTEILLKLLLGMIEILNSHTDQLNELQTQMSELDGKVSQLLKELTG